jgi:RNA polymerase sigma-70 factor, ECF subfamily
VKPRWSDCSEEQLIQASARGDGEALGELFDRHHQAVYRFLSRLSGTERSDLDDLVQETFVRVGRAASRFEGRSSVRSWILAIASHTAVDHVRAEARRRELLRSSVVDLPQAEGPDSRAEGREALARFCQALDGLAHDLRVTFVMCELEDTPGQEVAAALGVPEGTVWRRLHDARRALRGAMDRLSVPAKEAIND